MPIGRVVLAPLAVLYCAAGEVPDRCFCAIDGHEAFGAGCARVTELLCRFDQYRGDSSFDNVTQILDTIDAMALLPNVTDLILDFALNDVEINDDDWTSIGKRLTILSAQLKNLTLRDEGYKHGTGKNAMRSDEALRGFAEAIQDLALQGFTMDFFYQSSLGNPRTGGLEALGASLAGMSVERISLDLSFDERLLPFSTSNLTDDDFIGFFARISGNVGLQSIILHLGWNNISDVTMVAFADAVATLPALNLVDLCVRGTSFKNRGVSVLSDALARVTALRDLSLDLGDCQIDDPDQAIYAIGAGLYRMPLLERLWLCTEVFGGAHIIDGAGSLGGGLAQLRSLQHLHLDMTGDLLDIDASKLLGDGFRSLTSLKSLEVSLSPDSTDLESDIALGSRINCLIDAGGLESIDVDLLSSGGREQYDEDEGCVSGLLEPCVDAICPDSVCYECPHTLVV